MIDTSASSQKTAPLAIVGLSCLFPKAQSGQEFWSNIRRGVDAITEVPATHWRPEDYFDENPKSPDMTYARRGGFLSPVAFDPLEFGIAPSNLEAIDTSQLLGLVASKRALEDAGYGDSGKEFDRSRVSCVLGVTGTLELVVPLGARLGHPRWRQALKDAGVADDVAADVIERISDSYVPWQENSFPGLLGNVVAGRIANRLNLGGTNCVVDAACASSLSALHLAAMELWSGRSDMVLTGGVDTFNDIFMYMCFSKTPALSPSGDSRPFAENADGTMLGEGVGVLVVKRLADAQRDGDRIYALLKGIGTSSDGAGNAVYAPKRDGQIRCLEAAYQQADVSPDTIELLEAHGTGTRVGDAIEAAALNEVFRKGERTGRWCALGSVKSQIGHTKAAAGAAGVFKAILALQHRVLPPTLKVERPQELLLADDSPLYINNVARPWLANPDYPRRAAVSAFGFGGSNFHCVLEEPPTPNTTPDWDGDVVIAAFSGETRAALVQQLREWPASATWTTIRHQSAASRAAFRADHEHRLVCLWERDQTDVAASIEIALSSLERYADKKQWSTPEGVHYACGGREGQLAVLFPGQGSQAVGMLRELACRFPTMQDVLTDADAVFAECEAGSTSQRRLSDYIYPQPAWSDEERQQQEHELRATEVAQPAIGAVSLGALAILREFGVTAELTAGHSYGELTALCASRRFLPEALYRLSSLRGQLMAEAQEVDGGMLVVGASLSQVEAAIAESAVDLVVANRNSPNQVVLSGRLPDIERAVELFSRKNLRGKRLPVSAAFHSPLVAAASAKFRPLLDDVEFLPSDVPVFANTHAETYPDDPAAARDLLASQLAKPVEFVRQIENMYASGARCFIEVGPGNVLTGLVGSILSGRDVRTLAVDASAGKRSGLYDLANVLAQLSVAGYAVELAQWDPQPPVEPVPSDRMTIPLCGANYVKPRKARPPKAVTATAPVAGTAAASATTISPPAVTNGQSKTSVPQPPAATAAMAFAPRVTAPPRSVHAATASVSPSPAALVPAPIVPARTPAPPSSVAMHAVAEPPRSAVPAAHPASAPSTPRSTAMTPPSHTTLVAAPAARPDQLLLLQKMQEDTARLHRQFLEGQELALRSLVALAGVGNGTGAVVHNGFGNGIGSDVGNGVGTSLPVPVAEAPVLMPPTVPAAVSPAPVNRLTAAMPAPAPAPLATTPPRRPAPLPAAAPIPAAPAVNRLAPPPVAPAPSRDLGPQIMAVVAEKTGYPVEMLKPTMSLDHDLGIDSIKRVEILSAVQEQLPELPTVTPEQLQTLHRLQDVLDLLGGGAADTPAGASSSAVAHVSTNGAAPTAVDLGPQIMAVVAEKTGYPVEMLKPSMSLDHDLGIDSIKRVEILSAVQEQLPELPTVTPEQLQTLHRLQDVLDLLGGGAASTQNAIVNNGQHSGHSVAAVVVDLGPQIMAVVAEKTGYPVEMLKPSMSLDHDLGIDSIKRVEILSAVQEQLPELPTVTPEQLQTLHRLQDVLDLLGGGATAVAGIADVVVSPAKPVAVEVTDTAATAPATTADVLTCGTVRAVPVPAAANRERLALPAGGEIWITEDGSTLAGELATQLTAAGFKPRLVAWDTAAAPVTERAVCGLVLLTPLAGMSDQQLWQALRWTQLAGGALKQTVQNGGAAVLATVSRLDGRCGCGRDGALNDVTSGGLAGLTKTVSREWPELTCKALDLGGKWDSVTAAETLIQELLHVGPLEVGFTPDARIELQIEPLPGLPSESKSSLLEPGDLVVVTGGARGVTAAAATALAREFRPTLVLVGRSPLPEPEPDYLRGVHEPPHIKQALATHGAASTPRDLQRLCQQVLAGREIVTTLQTLRELGVTAEYRSADVRDAATMRELVASVQKQYGPIRGVVHGAGVLADQRINDKTAAQFDSVFGTKIDGLRHLLSALDAPQLRTLVLFSSFTARYGRTGQVDYAMANEVLNKQGQDWQRKQPACRVVSFNWGPWDGGMVQGGLRELFAKEGVGLIPLDAGADLVRRELQRTTSPGVEIVVLGPGSQPLWPEDADAGNTDTENTDTGNTVTDHVATDDARLAFRRELSLATAPYLSSHVLGGKAVLPVAMIVEWLAHAAVQRNAGLEFVGFENLQVFKGVRLSADETATLEVLIGKPRKQDQTFRVAAQLVCNAGDHQTRHAAAEIVLAPRFAPAPAAGLNVGDTDSRSISQPYDLLFHGPAFLGINQVERCSQEGMIVSSRTAAPPADWSAQPLRSQWLADPLALDVVLQSLIVWSRTYRGEPSLPAKIGGYSQFRRSFPTDGVQAVIRVTSSTDLLLKADVELRDAQGEVVAVVTGVEQVMNASLKAAFAQNSL